MPYKLQSTACAIVYVLGILLIASRDWKIAIGVFLVAWAINGDYSISK